MLSQFGTWMNQGRWEISIASLVVLSLVPFFSLARRFCKRSGSDKAQIKVLEKNQDQCTIDLVSITERLDELAEHQARQLKLLWSLVDDWQIQRKLMEGNTRLLEFLLEDAKGCDKNNTKYAKLESMLESFQADKNMIEEKIKKAELLINKLRTEIEQYKSEINHCFKKRETGNRSRLPLEAYGAPQELCFSKQLRVAEELSLTDPARGLNQDRLAIARS